MFKKLPIICVLLVALVQGSPAGIGDLVGTFTNPLTDAAKAITGTIKDVAIDHNPIVEVVKSVTQNNPIGDVVKGVTQDNPIVDAIKNNPIKTLLDTLKNVKDAGDLTRFVSEIQAALGKGDFRKVFEILLSKVFSDAVKQVAGNFLNSEVAENIIKEAVEEAEKSMPKELREYVDRVFSGNGSPMELVLFPFLILLTLLALPATAIVYCISVIINIRF